MPLAILLQKTGQFAATEWSQTLGDEIKAAQLRGEPDDGTTYYRHVLATLERLVSEKGFASLETLQSRRQSWEDAYRTTPHGQPVVLPGTPIREWALNRTQASAADRDFMLIALLNDGTSRS